MTGRDSDRRRELQEAVRDIFLIQSHLEYTRQVMAETNEDNIRNEDNFAVHVLIKNQAFARSKVVSTHLYFHGLVSNLLRDF